MTTKEIATSIYTIRKAQDMFTTMIRVMDVIKERKEITNKELQAMFPHSIQTMLVALKCCGKIRQENRKEETITVDKFGYHGPLDKDGFEIPMPDTITVTYEGHEMNIPNPFKTCTKDKYGDYKMKIQVTRKYWQWVE